MIGELAPAQIASAIALIVSVGIIAYLIYKNMDSGLILAVGGLVTLSFSWAIAAYQVGLTIYMFGVDILFAVAVISLVSAVLFIATGFWLFKKHTEEAAAREAKAEHERQQLEQKAAKADGNLLTRIIKGQ